MRWLIGVPVLALSIGCASSCKTPHCSEQHVVVHSADGTARVVKVPMQGSTGSRASGSPRYALGMDWAQISLPVPRLMAIPDHNVVPVGSHVVPPGMAMQSPSAPGATLKTMSPTSPAALAAKSAAATTTPITPATTTTASETTAPTPTAATQPTANTSEPTAATPPAPTTAEKPVPTMAEPLAVTHTTPAPTPPVTPPLPETVPVPVTPPGSAVVPASLPPLQEVAPATTPAPAAETSAPPLYLPDNPPVQRRPSVSQQEIEEMKRQLEALEKQLREQNTAPEVGTPK